MKDGEIECALVGRVTGDPQQRTSANGKPWMSLNLAVGSGDSVQFVSTAIFGDAATGLNVRKGDRLYIEGKISMRSWTNKDGQTKSGLSVACFSAKALGQIGERRPKGKADHRHDSSDEDSTPAQRDWQRPADKAPAQRSMLDEEIPFAPEVR